ncbi:hypothetical protein [Pseudoalteromonas phage J2-1_QLiu-2017]|nr:hypothetical protein [Pseudoalteromonas phage J2-1_QLiu-2017]
MRKFQPFALVAHVNPNIFKIKREIVDPNWANKHKLNLSNYANKLSTRRSPDIEHVIGGMLQAGYGYTLGNTLSDSLTSEELETIKANVISAVYM